MNSKNFFKKKEIQPPPAKPLPTLGLSKSADLDYLVTACTQYIQGQYKTLEERNSKLMGFIQPLFLAVDVLLKSQPMQEKMGFNSVTVAEEWLKVFIRHAPSCVALLDESFRYVTTSKTWDKAFLGRGDQSISDFPTKNSFFLDTFPYASLQFREALKSLDPKKVVEVIEDHYQSPKGEERWFHWEIYPWHRNPDEVGGYFFFGEEITFRKDIELKVEALSKLNVDLQSAMYLAPHDLQAHLRTITSFVDLIAEENSQNPNDTIQTYIDFINQGLSRMRSVMTDILQYAHLSSETLSITDVNIAALVEEMKQVFYFAFEQNKAHISCENLPIIKADIVLVRQALQNIIGNALKFSDGEGGVDIEIFAHSSKAEWIIGIRDNGIGIEEEHLSKVFDLFERASNRETCAGTGIGLAFVKKIMQLHQGKVWIESTKGEGATVFLSFPVPQ